MKPIDANIEKVIKGLEICTSRPCYCTDCPYTKECCLDSQNVMEDAIALLKEQEAVRPVKQIEQTEWTVCGNCRNHIISKWSFCPYCGKTVKWDG